VDSFALSGVTSDSEERSRSVAHILYRTSQAEARDLLENYQQIQASL
jgi:hypothetical protein